MRRPRALLAVLAATGLATLVWKELPAVLRYLKIERM